VQKYNIQRYLLSKIVLLSFIFIIIIIIIFCVYLQKN